MVARRSGGKAAAAAAARPRSAAASLPAWRPVAPAALGERIRAWAAAEVEERRLFLWLPVAFGVGIVFYFAAEAEPHMAAPAGAAALFSILALLARRRPMAFPVVAGLAAVFAGLLAASLRTATVAAGRIERAAIVEVAGYLEAVDLRPRGARFVIRPAKISSLEGAGEVYRLRIVARDQVTVAAGDFVTFRARLLPPPEPARPGGYDFARDAFFRGIGGVGTALGAIKTASPAQVAPLGLRVTAAIDRARNALTARIATSIGGEAGALAAALVTGKRDLIAEPTNEALRAAGIYHIVSISGLHMVIAAGAFFWFARALLALSPPVAARYPIKKLAAAIAMAGATAYCIFTGSEVATERSLIMILIMLGAILVDRPALSMRNLALAALIVLAREPETLAGPSFQMSFAAVAALVALGEWWAARQADPQFPATGVVARAMDWMLRTTLGLLATTLAASLATAPFAAYHFQRLNPLGLIGNALALPFVSLVVMPSATLGVLAYPFGLDGPIWLLMGYGNALVLAVAEKVAALPGAVVAIRAFGVASLLVMALSLAWLCLWQTPLRWAGLLPAVLGISLAARVDAPDLIVAREGAGAAIRKADGVLAIVGRPSAFDIAVWLRADGDLRKPTDPTLTAGNACDRFGCIGTGRSDRIVSVVREPYAFPEDCRRAHIVVSRLRAPDFCKPNLVVDQNVLDRRGAVEATFTADGAVRIIGARSGEGRRPWEAQRNRPPPTVAPPPAGPQPLPRGGEPEPEFDRLQ